jgi:hypothetical protein
MATQVEVGNKTFTASEALAAFRRVKLSSASGTAVEYADAGDEHIGMTQTAAASGALVTVRLRTAEGTLKGTAKTSFAAGAVLYGADDGKIDDASNGSSIGTAVNAASADGDVCEFIPAGVKSTTAATVSIADAGAFTAQTTAEAALAEIYQHILSVQKTVCVPLGAITREDGTALTAQATTVAGYSQIGNKEQVINIPVDCSAGEALGFNVPLPLDLDDAKDVVVKVLVSKATDNDVLTLDAEAYFVAAGDLQNTDSQDTAAQTIVAAGTVLSFTCGADGVPAAPAAVTVVLTLGGTNDGDAVYIHGVWVQYGAKLLTS